MLAKWLKFIPTPVTNDNLLHDFEQFEGECNYNTCTTEQHPFYVKSNWNPPVQQSVAPESYLEELKIPLAEINLNKP